MSQVIFCVRALWMEQIVARGDPTKGGQPCSPTATDISHQLSQWIL